MDTDKIGLYLKVALKYLGGITGIVTGLYQFTQLDFANGIIGISAGLAVFNIHIPKTAK